MTRIYSFEASSRRWPKHECHNMINSALINSHILYKHVCKEDISRRKFIQRVCEELTNIMPCKAPEDKDMLEELPCKVHGIAERSGSTSKRPRLTCCSVKCKNRTTNNCNFCQQQICGTHAKTYG